MHVYDGLEYLTGNRLEDPQVFIALLISQNPGSTSDLERFLGELLAKPPCGKTVRSIDEGALRQISSRF